MVPLFPGAKLQVKYKEVMKQYNLGPNGGILTSLNLFATRFDQVSGRRFGILRHQHVPFKAPELPAAGPAHHNAAQLMQQRGLGSVKPELPCA